MVAAPVGVAYKLDELDVALLRSLVADARMSQRQLAEVMGDASAPAASLP